MKGYDESRGTAFTSWGSIFRYNVFVCSIKLRRLQIKDIYKYKHTVYITPRGHNRLNNKNLNTLRIKKSRIATTLSPN